MSLLPCNCDVWTMPTPGKLMIRKSYSFGKYYYFIMRALEYGMPDLEAIKLQVGQEYSIISRIKIGMKAEF